MNSSSDLATACREVGKQLEEEGAASFMSFTRELSDFMESFTMVTRALLGRDTEPHSMDL